MYFLFGNVLHITNSMMSSTQCHNHSSEFGHSIVIHLCIIAVTHSECNVIEQSVYRIVGIFRGGKFLWMLIVLLARDKNFVVK